MAKKSTPKKDRIPELQAMIESEQKKIAQGNQSAAKRLAQAKDLLDEALNLVMDNGAESARMASETSERLAALGDALAQQNKDAAASSALEKKISLMETALAEHENASQSAKERITILESELAEQASKETSEGNHGVELEQKLASVQAELGASEGRIELLGSELVEKGSALEQAEEQIAALQTEEVSQRETVAESTQELESLEQSLTDQRESYDEASARVGVLESSETKLTKELEELRARARQTAESERNAKESLAEMKQFLSDARDEATALRGKAGEAEGLNKKAEQAKKLLHAEQDRAAELQDRLDEELAKGTKTSLAEQLAEALRDREQMHGELMEVRKEAEQLRRSSGVAEVSELKPAVAETQHAAPPKNRLGAILVNAGVLSQERLDEALKVQRQNPQKRIGTILVDEGFASEDAVAQAHAIQQNVQFLRLTDDMVDPEATRLIPARLAQQHRCIPLKATKESITLAMVNPLDLIAIDEIERESRRHVEPVAATGSDVLAYIRDHYNVD